MLEIRAVEVTDNFHRCSTPVLPCLLDHIAVDNIISNVSGDSADDMKSFREAIVQWSANDCSDAQGKPSKDQSPAQHGGNSHRSKCRRVRLLQHENIDNIAPKTI